MGMVNPSATCANPPAHAGLSSLAYQVHSRQQCGEIVLTAETSILLFMHLIIQAIIGCNNISFLQGSFPEFCS